MSRIVSTTQYETDTAELSASTYTLSESMYLDIDTMLATNNVANSITDIGVIGILEEAPDLSGSGTPDRMVIRLTASDSLLDPIKRILQSKDL